MSKYCLFPQVKELLHGGDYNPEQWLDRPDILSEDIKLMKEASINVVTLGVFSWAVLEPEEGVFCFEWLDCIIDRLYENGIYIILATPSGARPAWLDEKYPEALRVRESGIRNLHGVRHNHCISSNKYREKVREIDRHLAMRYGKHPGLILWHISNELGGECYCELCKKNFQRFLKEKYHGDIDELNREWWTTFWSHKFRNFDQIDPPTSRGENSIHGMNLDWKRFTTYNTGEFLKEELRVIREITPGIPATTNFMKLYNGLDYHKLAQEIDIISWDSYPKWHTNEETLWDTASNTAFDHSIMRSFKRDKPFMLMESTPSLVNWHPYNKLKRPGIHKLSSIQAVACGSDTIQYFQWRKGRGSFEQYHGAVIDHLGKNNTRVFRDVKEVGEVLKKIKSVQGSIIKSDVAIIFDWNNRWAIEDFAGLSKDKKYVETCQEQFKIFLKHGIDVDVISSEEDLSSYKMVIAPMLYLLKPATALKLKEFVELGGNLIATYLTGYVNENTLCYLGGFPGDGLQELFGIYSEEIDTLYPKEKNGIRFNENDMGKEVYEAYDFCEIIHTKGAKVLARYISDFYKDYPVITENTYGVGKAYYVGARTELGCMETLYKKILDEIGLEYKEIPEGIEYHKRVQGEEGYMFYLNYTDYKQSIKIQNEGVNLISGEKVSGNIDIEPYDILVISEKGGE